MLLFMIWMSLIQLNEFLNRTQLTPHKQEEFIQKIVLYWAYTCSIALIPLDSVCRSPLGFQPPDIGLTKSSEL